MNLKGDFNSVRIRSWVKICSLSLCMQSHIGIGEYRVNSNGHWLKSGSSSYQCRHRTDSSLTVSADPRVGWREGEGRGRLKGREPTRRWKSQILKRRRQKAGAKASKTWRAKMCLGGKCVPSLRWKELPGCLLMRKYTSGIWPKLLTMVTNFQQQILVGAISADKFFSRPQRIYWLQ